MNFYPISATFCVEMNLNQFHILDNNIAYSEVAESLSDLPVTNIEYHGHFGANLFFDIGEMPEGFTFAGAKLVAHEVSKRIKKLIRDKK